MPRVFRASSSRPRIVGPKRAVPRARGYDAAWDRRFKAFRRRHPFCARCEEADWITFAVMVDHKFPVQDGGEVHCLDAGLWSLCAACHGWKGRLESFARETGQMHFLV